MKTRKARKARVRSIPTHLCDIEHESQMLMSVLRRATRAVQGKFEQVQTGAASACARNAKAGTCCISQAASNALIEQGLTMLLQTAKAAGAKADRRRRHGKQCKNLA